MTDKIDIFNENADFFERFSNSNQELTTDRLGRSRKTIHGIEKAVEDSINGAVDGIGTAKDSAIQEVNNMGDSVGTGKVVRESIVSSIGSGKVMREGAYGLGGTLSNIGDSRVGVLGGYGNYTSIRSFRTVGSGFEIVNFYSNNNIFIRRFFASAGGWGSYIPILTGANTIVDGNGNLKAASPVLRLFNDRIETNDQFAEEPMFEKISTGKYKISNTQGLATEGWYIETPKDKNGLPYFMVEWEQDEESHDVTILVFRKKLDLDTLDFVNGEPIDIGADERWIDLRFHEEEQGLDNE